ncbi:hypothetical protein HanPSC8_Chr02g0051041 [Helianthus annuus]|nr:hypothetical protein HanPSC8_Chr02g0051041 [Helianthus annuus]
MFSIIIVTTRTSKRYNNLVCNVLTLGRILSGPRPHTLKPDNVSAHNMNHRARYILVLIRSQCNAPCILVGIGPVHVNMDFGPLGSLAY